MVWFPCAFSLSKSLRKEESHRSLECFQCPHCFARYAQTFTMMRVLYVVVFVVVVDIFDMDIVVIVWWRV